MFLNLIILPFVALIETIKLLELTDFTDFLVFPDVDFNNACQ